MQRTNHEQSLPADFFDYFEGNFDGIGSAIRRRAVFTRSGQGDWTLVMCVVRAYPSLTPQPSAVSSRRYERVVLSEDWLDSAEVKNFAQNAENASIAIGAITIARDAKPHWQTERVAATNNFMRQSGLVVRARFEERPLDLSQAPLVSGSEPYYPDVTTAARDWLELPVYHGSSDARNGELVFLLPEARALIAKASRRGGRLKLTIDGSAVGHERLIVKGAYWLGQHMQHVETEVREGLADLAVPDEADRLDYYLIDSKDQTRDFRYESRRDDLAHTAIFLEMGGDAAAPEAITAETDNADEAHDPVQDTPQSGETTSRPPFREPTGDASIERAWAERAQGLAAQLKAVESALATVSTAFAQIREANPETGRSELPAGIGHNNPPAESALAWVDMEQAIAAKDVLEAEVTSAKPSLPVLKLAASVLAGAANFASWLLHQGRVFIEEAVKAAGKKFGEGMVQLAKLYTSLEILSGQIPPIVDVIRAFLHGIGFLH